MIPVPAPVRPSPWARLLRLLEHSAGARDLFLAASVGAVLAVGTAATMRQAPPATLEPVLSSFTLPVCDGATTAITLAWQVDTATSPASVTGVTLGDVPAGCALRPITVSLSDSNGATLASVTNPPGSPLTDFVAVPFEFASPVAIPAIEGFRAEIPDELPFAAALPIGTDVAASFVDPTSGSYIAVTFASVTSAGALTAAALVPGDAGYVEPVGFTLGSPATSFDIATTAGFAATVGGAPGVEVCVWYDVATMPAGVPVSLFHYAGGAWSDATSSRDAASGLVCGAVADLSPFALGIAGSTMTVTSVPAASVAYGTSVTATATVTGALPDGAGGVLDPTAGSVATDYCFDALALPATCTVAEVDGSIAAALPLAAGANPADGAATASASFTPAETGFYRLRSRFTSGSIYSGSDEWGGTGAALQVTRLATATSLATSTTAPVLGQAVTLTGTVTPTTGVLAGSIAFSDGTVPLGTCPLGAGGSCSISVATLAVGRHSLRATYLPDANHLGSASTTTTVTVGRAPTTTQLAASATSTAFGSSIAFATTVTPAFAAATPTGTVTFYDGRTKLGTCTLASGACSLSVASLSVGTHLITATYGGDGNYDVSTTATAQSVAILRATAVPTLAVSPGSSVTGQSVALTATVAPLAATGTVTFYDGSLVLGTCSLRSGTCAISTSALPVGTRQLTVGYGGDGSYLPGTSVAVSHTVSRAATAVTLKPASTTVRAGTSVSITIAVAAAAPGAGTPTGTVTWSGIASGSAALVNGTYKLTFTATTAGTLTIAYGGDGKYLSSSAIAIVSFR